MGVKPLPHSLTKAMMGIVGVNGLIMTLLTGALRLGGAVILLLPLLCLRIVNSTGIHTQQCMPTWLK